MDSKRKLRAVISDRRQQKRLLAHLWRHFKEDRCLDEAASLGYTSLLSLVPLLAVMFGIASAFPVFETWSGDLKVVIYSNLVPETGNQLQDNLDRFLGSVNSLTLTGTIFLILTALLLMMRIESSFNRIWRVPVERKLLARIMVYWTVLTLGPLALGAAAAMSAQPLIQWIGGEMVTTGTLRGFGVFLLTWLAFMFMFLLVPNCRVPLSYAAIGALLSTFLFTLAKTGFVAFVSRANYSVIYGALASVPVFLMWLYVVWLVILLGASLAAALTTFTDRGTDWRWPRSWEFLLVYRLMGHFYQAQLDGRSLSLEELRDLEPGVPSTRLQALLALLAGEGLLTQDREEDWLLKRDLDHYSLRDLYDSGEYHLPLKKSAPIPSISKWDRMFLDLLDEPELDLDRSLASLYEVGLQEGVS